MKVNKTGPLIGTAPLPGGTAPLPPSPVAPAGAATSAAEPADLDLTTGAGQNSQLTLGAAPARPEGDNQREGVGDRNLRLRPQADSNANTELR